MIADLGVKPYFPYCIQDLQAIEVNKLKGGILFPPFYGVLNGL
jgi:hypothetical protein